MKELLFSVTKKDLEIQTFRAGGKGGQNQNKVESGVRIVHRESGAVGEARDTRDQIRNKRLAFERMAASPRFRAWHKLKCAAVLQGKTVDQLVEEQMAEENLKVEVFTPGGNSAAVVHDRAQ